MLNNDNADNNVSPISPIVTIVSILHHYSPTCDTIKHTGSMQNKVKGVNTIV